MRGVVMYGKLTFLIAKDTTTKPTLALLLVRLWSLMKSNAVIQMRITNASKRGVHFIEKENSFYMRT